MASDDPEYADLCGKIEAFNNKVNKCRAEARKKQQEAKAASAASARAQLSAQPPAEVQAKPDLCDALEGASAEEVAKLLQQLAQKPSAAFAMQMLHSEWQKHRQAVVENSEYRKVAASQGGDMPMADVSKRQAEVAALLQKDFSPQNKRLCTKTAAPANAQSGAAAFGDGKFDAEMGLYKLMAGGKL